MSRLASRDAAQRPARTVSHSARMESPPKVRPWPRPADWTESAACVGHDPDIFDTVPFKDAVDRRDFARRAIAIYATCPVVTPCRELGDSMPANDRYGLIFGGHQYGSRAFEAELTVRPYDLCGGPCKRPLRPRDSSVRDYPGTLRVVARRMCNTCDRKLPR